MEIVERENVRFGLVEAKFEERLLVMQVVTVGCADDWRWWLESGLRAGLH